MAFGAARGRALGGKLDTAPKGPDRFDRATFAGAFTVVDVRNPLHNRAAGQHPRGANGSEADPRGPFAKSLPEEQDHEIRNRRDERDEPGVVEKPESFHAIAVIPSTR